MDINDWDWHRENIKIYKKGEIQNEKINDDMLSSNPDDRMRTI